MDYCWARSEQEGSRLAALSLSFSFMLMIGIFMKIIRQELPLAGFLMACLPAAFRFAVVSSRKYSVGREGLTIRYLLGMTKVYSWDCFTDVGLCRVHPGAGANTSTLAIRCVIGGEQFGPRQATSAREDWARRFYEIWHYKKIISIYHTPERMADFQRYCPFPILDYSNLV